MPAEPPGCVVTPFWLPSNCTLASLVKFSPSRVTPVMLAPGAAKEGCTDISTGPAGGSRLVNGSIQVPRPCVSARRMRDWLRRFTPITATLGRLPGVFAPPRRLHCAAAPALAFDEVQTPFAVPIYSVSATSGSATISCTGMFGRLPVMSSQVAPPSGDRKTWPLVSAPDAKPSYVTYTRLESFLSTAIAVASRPVGKTSGLVMSVHWAAVFCSAFWHFWTLPPPSAVL